MGEQTIAMRVLGVTFGVDSSEITDEGKDILKGDSGQLGDLFNAMFVTDNGDYGEIIDDSEDDEIDPSKVAIEIVAVESDNAEINIELNIELEFPFITLQELTTESLSEWEEENEPLAFGLSLFINNEFLTDEDEICTYEGYSNLYISVPAR